MPTGLEELAFETSLGALRRQEEELNQLRARTGMLLAAGSLVASFFGSSTLGRSGTAPWAALAIIAFVISILPCVYLLAPKKGLVFSLSGSALHRRFEGAPSLDPVYLQLTTWLQSYWNANQEKMDRMNQFFALASGSLVAEVVFWALALRGTI